MNDRPLLEQDLQAWRVNTRSTSSSWTLDASELLDLSFPPRLFLSLFAAHLTKFEIHWVLSPIVFGIDRTLGFPA